MYFAIALDNWNVSQVLLNSVACGGEILPFSQCCLSWQERVVVETGHWLCVVPYWAKWPYETMLLPKEHRLRLDELSAPERDGKAGVCESFTISHMVENVCIKILPILAMQLLKPFAVLNY